MHFYEVFFTAKRLHGANKSTYKQAIPKSSGKLLFVYLITNSDLEFT